MKNLYVIGNGFDLHHGMKTSYTDFRDWLIAHESSVLDTIDELFGDCDNAWWRDLENNLATAVTSEVVKEEVQENYPDFGSDDFRDSDWYAAEIANTHFFQSLNCCSHSSTQEGRYFLCSQKGKTQ